MYFCKNKTFMQTIQLKISDKVYDKFIWLLGKFSSDEVEIVSDNKEFISTKAYLQKELDEIESGKAIFYSQEELEEKLDKTLGNYENNL